METKNNKFLFINIISLLSSKPLLAAAPQAYKAGINVKDASYNIQSNDFPNHLPFKKEYSSASLFKGLFGRGWCSELDRKLEIYENEIRLIDCHQAKEIVFKKKKDSYISDNGERLEKPDEFAFKYKNMEFNNEGCLTQLLDGRRRLYSIQTKEGYPVEIRLNKDALAKIVVSRSNKKIQSISDVKGLKITYHFDHENLVWMKSNRTGTNSFEYNEFHNLIKWKSSGGHEENLKYDNIADQIIKRNVGPCVESVQYSEKDSGLQMQAVVKRSCEKNSIAETKYDFNYIRKPSGERSLDTMNIHTSRGSFQVNYDLVSGLAKHIGRNK